MFETPASALLWVARVIAVAVILQTIETWAIRRSAADDGVWRWETVRRELDVFPRVVRGILDALLGYRSLRVVLVVRAVAAVALVVIGLNVVVLAVLLATTVLLALRWRGSVNGGSDFMTLVVLTALTVAAAAPGRPEVQLGCVWYVAIQACNSYFVAGVVKARAASWRQGRALPAFLATAVYDDARLVALFKRRPGLARAAGYAVIGLECGFPLALVHPVACLAIIGAAAAFHLANVYVFGLNRFLWAWMATYPALVYCSQNWPH